MKAPKVYKFDLPRHVPRFWNDLAKFIHNLQICAPGIPFLVYGGVLRDMVAGVDECNDFDIMWGGTEAQLRQVFPDCKALSFDGLQHVFTARYYGRELNIGIIPNIDGSFEQAAYSYTAERKPLKMNALMATVEVTQHKAGYDIHKILILDYFSAFEAIKATRIDLMCSFADMCQLNPFLIFRMIMAHFKGYGVSGDDFDQLLTVADVSLDQAMQHYCDIPGRVNSFLHRIFQRAPCVEVVTLLDQLSLWQGLFPTLMANIKKNTLDRANFFKQFQSLRRGKLHFSEQVYACLLKQAFMSTAEVPDLTLIPQWIEVLHERFAQERFCDRLLLYLLMLHHLLLVDPVKKQLSDPIDLTPVGINMDISSSINKFIKAVGLRQAIMVFQRYQVLSVLLPECLHAHIQAPDFDQHLDQVVACLDGDAVSHSQEFFACLILAAHFELARGGQWHLSEMMRLAQQWAEALGDINQGCCDYDKPLIFFGLQHLMLRLQFQSKTSSALDLSDPFKDCGGVLSRALVTLLTQNQAHDVVTYMRSSGLLHALFPQQLRVIEASEHKQRQLDCALRKLPGLAKVRFEHFYASLLSAAISEPESDIDPRQNWLQVKNLSTSLCEPLDLYFRLLTNQLDTIDITKQPFFAEQDFPEFVALARQHIRVFMYHFNRLLQGPHAIAVLEAFIRQGILSAIFPKPMHIIGPSPKLYEQFIALFRAQQQKMSIKDFLAIMIAVAYFKPADYVTTDMIERAMTDSLNAFLPDLDAQQTIALNDLICDKGDLRAAILRQVMQMKRLHSSVKGPSQGASPRQFRLASKHDKGNAAARSGQKPDVNLTDHEEWPSL